MILDNTDRNSQIKISSLRVDVQRSLQSLMRLMRNSGGFLKLNIHDIDSVFLTSKEECQYAFLWSAFLGRLNFLRQFHADGANLQYHHPLENYNALHLAALSGSLECVQWLLSRNCPITRTLSSLTPLHFAAFAGSTQVCHELIKSKCPLDATVLNAAVCSGTSECVQYILHEGCLVNGCDDDGWSPLHTATNMGTLEILKELLNSKSVELNARTRLQKYTALHIAAELGNLDYMRVLLENGANVNGVCPNGTALHLASKLSFVECVEILLDYGAQVNVRDDEGRTPLHVALSKSPWSMLTICKLVERGKADVNAKDHAGFTALHVAAIQELEKGVEYLIEKGANVAATTKGGITALNFIARRMPHSLKEIPKHFNVFISYKEQTLKLNFREILHNSTIGESGFLYTLQNEGQAHYLLHPLCRAFLFLKWQKVQCFILFRIVLSSIAAILLSFLLVTIIMNCEEGLRYQLLFPHCDHFTLEDCEQNLSIFPLNDFWKGRLQEECPSGLLKECDLVKSWDHDSANCSISPSGTLTFHEHTSSILTLFWLSILLHLGFNTTRIFFSLPAYKAVKNSFNWVNAVEVVNMLLVLSLGLMRHKNTWYQEHVAITILSSWLYVVLIFSQLPFFGMHIAMFLNVLKQFVKTILAFSFLLFGFAFTFCVLKEEIFQNPITGFVQTLVMMTGELNADQIIEKQVNTDRMVLEYTSLVVFMIMILVLIVLMNLSIGLAVSNVEDLHKKAEICEVTQMSQLIFFIEKTCFHGFFNFHEKTLIAKVLRKCLCVFPDPYVVAVSVQPANQREKRLPKDIMDAAIQVADERTTARSKMYDKTLTIDQRIDGLEKQLSGLEKQLYGLDKQLGGLQAMIQKLNENWENNGKTNSSTYI